MNRVTLRNRDSTVERARFLLRRKFLAAIMPSKPNSFFVSGEVRTFFAFIVTSLVCRIESMGETFSALRAGIHAAISVVARHIAAAAASAPALSTRRMDTPSAEASRAKTPRRRYRVIPMPAQPTTRPTRMPMLPSRRASYSTQDRICFFVAPTDFSRPNWRVLSLTEMEKEL